MVVLPIVWKETRSLDSSNRLKYSTTCSHEASLRSSPGWNPRTSFGVGTVLSAEAGRARLRQRSNKQKSSLIFMFVGVWRRFVISCGLVDSFFWRAIHEVTRTEYSLVISCVQRRKCNSKAMGFEAGPNSAGEADRGSRLKLTLVTTRL